MFGNGVLIGIIITLHQTIVLMCKAVLLPILKVLRQALTVLGAAAAGAATWSSALWASGAAAVLAAGTAMLASGWLAGPRVQWIMGNSV